MREVVYTPPPIVRDFMLDDSFVRAIVGPLGSGKSSGCVMEIPRRAGQQQPSTEDGVRKTRWAVIRNTGPQLQQTTRKTFEEWIPSGVGYWNESDFTYTIERDDLHCEVLFLALDRPQDVQKVLSLNLTGAYINEAREIPKEIVDGVQGRVGRYPPMKEGGPSWFGVWMDTNPWAVGSWGHELFSVQKPEGHALYEQPSGLSDDAENVDNLPPGYYSRLCHGKSTEWIDEYVHAKYPKSDKGSIFGKYVADLEQRGGLKEFEHPRDGVVAVFDLGVGDATAIWWFRLNGNRMPDLVDWYENTGQGAQHYFDILDGKEPEGAPEGVSRHARDYQLRHIYIPHDGRHRSWQTGISTIEQFKKKFTDGQVSIVPELPLKDGIDAARWLLEQPMRIHPRCGEGIKRLKAYRFAWDEDNLVYSKTPLHNFASHTADAFRYVACVVKPVDVKTAPADEKKPEQLVRPANSFTLNELIAARSKAIRKGKGYV